MLDKELKEWESKVMNDPELKALSEISVLVESYLIERYTDHDAFIEEADKIEGIINKYLRNKGSDKLSCIRSLIKKCYQNIGRGSDRDERFILYSEIKNLLHSFNIPADYIVINKLKFERNGKL